MMIQRRVIHNFSRDRLHMWDFGCGAITLNSVDSIKRVSIQLHLSLGLKDDNIRDITRITGIKAYLHKNLKKIVPQKLRNCRIRNLKVACNNLNKKCFLFTFAANMFLLNLIPYI